MRQLQRKPWCSVYNEAVSVQSAVRAPRCTRRETEWHTKSLPDLLQWRKRKHRRRSLQAVADNIGLDTSKTEHVIVSLAEGVTARTNVPNGSASSAVPAADKGVKRTGPKPTKSHRSLGMQEKRRVNRVKKNRTPSKKTDAAIPQAVVTSKETEQMVVESVPPTAALHGHLCSEDSLISRRLMTLLYTMRPLASVHFLFNTLSSEGS